MLIRPSQREAPITVKCCRAAADFQYYYEHYVYSILTMMSAWLKHSALECSNDPLLSVDIMYCPALACAHVTRRRRRQWRAGDVQVRECIPVSRMSCLSDSGRTCSGLGRLCSQVDYLDPFAFTASAKERSRSHCIPRFSVLLGTYYT